MERLDSPGTSQGRWASRLFGWELDRLSLAIVGAFALLNLCELRLLQLLQGDLLAVHATIAESVVTRHAYWRAFQNRLLGPHLVEQAALLTGSTFDAAYLALTQSFLVLANVLCFVFVRRLTRSSRAAFLAVVAFAGLFIAVQDVKWLYIWDFIDLIVFLVFVQAVVTEARARAFVYLFFIELLSREAAQFIALWLVLSAYEPDARRWMERLRWPRAVLGTALLLLGAWWTSYIRARLFITSMEPAIGDDLEHLANGEHLQLGDNLGRLLFPHRTDIAVSVAMFWLLGWVLRRCWRLKLRWAKPLVLLGAAMMASTVLFGVINETRIYISFIPFIVILGVVSRRAPLEAARVG
jgi:hypothetical protein